MSFLAEWSLISQRRPSASTNPAMSVRVPCFLRSVTAPSACLTLTLCLACSNDLQTPESIDSPTLDDTTATSASSGSGSSSDSTSATTGSGSGGAQDAVTTSDGSGGGTSSGTCATADVRTIFQTSCTQSVCHDANQPAAMLDLSGADPAGQMLDVSSSLCTNAIRLVAGEPDQSLLWLKLTQETPDCGERMPIGGVLSDAELACVEQWILGLASGVPDCETCGGTACVDLSNDALHCGACDVSCETGQVCTDGACVGCADGETACGTACVDTDSDPNHCGGCGMACGAGESCVAGSCQCTADETVTFSGDIAPLFDGTCGGVACHGGRMPKQGLDLTAGASYESLVGVVADQCSDGRLLVDPGAPADSYLLQKLSGIDLCFGTLMPKADGALPQETVDKISGWICNGAPDN